MRHLLLCLLVGLCALACKPAAPPDPQDHATLQNAPAAAVQADASIDQALPVADVAVSPAVVVTVDAASALPADVTLRVDCARACDDGNPCTDERDKPSLVIGQGPSLVQPYFVHEKVDKLGQRLLWRNAKGDNVTVLRC